MVEYLQLAIILLNFLEMSLLGSNVLEHVLYDFFKGGFYGCVLHLN
jgi:hypothetical protein